MKKIMNPFAKAMMPALLVLALFSGCTKDNTETFILAFQSPNGGKAYLNDRYACWSDGDEVKINGMSYTVTVATPTATTKQARILNVTHATDYYAIYPASYCSGVMTGTANILLPTTIHYSDGKFEAPMAAKANSNNVMLFYNLCVLLEVNIPATNTIIDQITVKSLSGRELSGPASVSFSGTVPSLGAISGSAADTKVVLNLGNGVNVQNGGTFYIPVPPIAQDDVLQIYVKDKFSQTETSKKVKAKQDVNANNIVPVAGPTPYATTDYTFFDWIESQGSGYIQLVDCKPTRNSILQLTYSVSNTTSTQYLAGSRGDGVHSGGVQWFALGGPNGKNYFHARYCDSLAANTVANGGWIRQTGKKYETTMEVRQVGTTGSYYGYVTFKNLTDGLENIISTPATNAAIPSGAGDIILFGLSTNTSEIHRGMKCYGFKVWRNGSLYADFVPCRRNSNPPCVGVYDMVSGEFMEPTVNPSATTPFTVGND